jgi:hypothetical protein
MDSVLSQSSERACQALLVNPSTSEPIDPVALWRERFQLSVRPRSPHLFKAVSLAKLHDCMADLLPSGQMECPGWFEYRNALWIRGAGALYDGESGLALPGTFLTRGVRQQEAPHCKTFRVELTNPQSRLSRMLEVMYLPFAFCSNFGHFMTETLAFLWPLFSRRTCPAVGSGCFAAR